MKFEQQKDVSQQKRDVWRSGSTLNGIDRQLDVHKACLHISRPFVGLQSDSSARFGRGFGEIRSWRIDISRPLSFFDRD